MDVTVANTAGLWTGLRKNNISVLFYTNLNVHQPSETVQVAPS